MMDLPPEVLSLVFVHALDDQPNRTCCADRDIDNNDDDNQLGPLFCPRHPYLFGSVCREWRAVAFSTPQLWNRLVVTYNVDDLQTDFARIGACLERSGGLAIRLSLTVKGRHSFTTVSEAAACNAAKTFARHSSRWEHVLLQLPLAVVRAMGRQSRMPLLRTLRLQISMRDVPYHKMTAYTSTPLSAFSGSKGGCPRLEQIVAVRQAPFSLFRTVPWEQITRISGLAISQVQLMHLLRVAPMLTDIDFIDEGPRIPNSNSSHGGSSNAMDDDNENTPFVPVTHKRLRTFAVKSGGDDHHIINSSFISSTNNTQLLDILALPSLEELRMSKFGGHWYPHTFDRFVARSDGLVQLRKLRVAGYHGMGDEEAVAALSLLPGLTECALMGALHAGNARIGDRFLAKLIARRGSSSSEGSSSKGGTTLFPNMQKLKLLPCRFTDSTQAILVRILSSRARQLRMASPTTTSHSPALSPCHHPKKVIELYCDEGASRWDGNSPSAALLDSMQPSPGGQGGFELHVHSSTTCWLDYPTCRQRRGAMAMDARTWPGSGQANSTMRASGGGGGM